MEKRDEFKSEITSLIVDLDNNIKIKNRFLKHLNDQIDMALFKDIQYQSITNVYTNYHNTCCNQRSFNYSLQETSSNRDNRFGNCKAFISSQSQFYYNFQYLKFWF